MLVVRPLTLAIAFAAVLAGVQLARGPVPPPAPPAGAHADDRGVDRIGGVIAGMPIATPLGFGVELATESSSVWLWTDERVDPGELVIVTGRLRTARGVVDPGAPPAPQREPFELSATSIERLGIEPSWRAAVLRWAARTQRGWVATLGETTAASDPGAAALRGILTGDRGTVPVALDDRWRACGIFHALSVSGLHLAVVAGLVFALLRRLAAASPWGGRIRPARWAAPPALLAAIAYTLITGAQVATLRSLVVIAIVLIAQMLDRDVRLIDALGLAAIVLLAWRPGDLGDPSFQLSFAAALALALRPKRVRPVGRRMLAWHWLCEGVATSAWVALVTAPLTAYHFHQVQPGGVIGNLLLTPLLELIALPLGLAGLALHAIWPAGGALAIRGAAWVVGLVDTIAGVLARVTPVGNVALASAVAVALLVGLALWLLTRARRTRLDAIAWIALACGWLVGRAPPPPGALRVTFLDVGQGDAAIVELPDGKVWLVDAGGLASRRDLAAAAAPGRTITRALEAFGHAQIDLAIISHPHPDHYLGLAALAVPVRELWAAAGDADHLRDDQHHTALPSFADVAAIAPLHHPPLGLAREQGGVELWVWAPRFRERDGAAEREAVDPVRTVNDNSLVVELRYAGRSILFAGDVEAEGEAALIAAGLGHVDVVKVAHHGSPTSSTPSFIAATHPEVAVISCGVANTFGFPATAVVERWRAGGADVERTDTGGAITVTIAPDQALDHPLDVDRFVGRFVGPPP
ncbi:MAG: ComEC/Rec2 family competence protein [Kofleriaceae bacterium]